MERLVINVFIMSNKNIEHGRYQLTNLNPTADTTIFFLENVNQDKDFWLTVSNEIQTEIIGFIKFKLISPNNFVIAEVRPANCPIHAGPDACMFSLKSQTKET